MSRQLMPATDIEGQPVTVGAGPTTGGGIALLNNAPDGRAFLHDPGASAYLALLRRVTSESAGQR